MAFDMDGCAAVDDLEIAYCQRGTGPLILLLHGFPDSPATFVPLAEVLADAGYRAVVPWMRGYGPTGGDAPTGLARLGRDALGLAEAIAPGEPFAIIGHDWGAVAGCLAGTLAPERLAALVTLGLPHPAHFLTRMLGDLGQLARSWYIWFFQLASLPEQVAVAEDFGMIDLLWDRWSPGYQRTQAHRAEVNASLDLHGPDAAIGYYRAIFAEAAGGGDPDDGALFGPVGVPTLSMMGADDGCIDAALLAGQAVYWDAPLEEEVLAACGHFLHLERPGDVRRRVLSFLDERYPARRA